MFCMSVGLDLLLGVVVIVVFCYFVLCLFTGYIVYVVFFELDKLCCGWLIVLL